MDIWLKVWKFWILCKLLTKKRYSYIKYISQIFNYSICIEILWILVKGPVDSRMRKISGDGGGGKDHPLIFCKSLMKISTWMNSLCVYVRRLDNIFTINFYKLLYKIITSFSFKDLALKSPGTFLYFDSCSSVMYNVSILTT